jgi:hypothetical protein
MKAPGSRRFDVTRTRSVARSRLGVRPERPSRPRRGDHEHAPRRCGGESRRDTPQEEALSRGSLALGADHDQVGAEVRGDVQKLLPRCPSTDEKLDVDALAVGSRSRNGFRELRPQVGRGVGEQRHAGWVVERMHASQVRTRLGSETHGVPERPLGRLAEVCADHDPSVALHLVEKRAPRAPPCPWSLREIFVYSADPSSKSTMQLGEHREVTCAHPTITRECRMAREGDCARSHA